MENYDITLKWSRLLPLTNDEISKIDNGVIESVYRVSKKESDGRFYVIFIGSTPDLKKELLELTSKKDINFLKQGGEFSFRYAPVNKGEETRKAIEKQMYKKYAPENNLKKPTSSLEIKVNLN